MSQLIRIPKDGFEYVQVSPATPAPKTSSPPSSSVSKAPIPAHLLAMKNNRAPGRGRRVKPVAPKWRRGPGWRGVTAGSVADYGLKAWQLAKHLATLINVEDKKFDVSSNAALTTTPTVVNLSNIAQGNDYVNRSGDSILAQRIEFKGLLLGNTNSTGHAARVLIVVDHDQRGTDPVVTDVLASATITSLSNPLAGNRFTILYDHVVTLDQDFATVAPTYVMARALFPAMDRKYNQHLKYISTAGADASNYEGALYMMAFCGDASNGPTLYYDWRLHFSDN